MVLMMMGLVVIVSGEIASIGWAIATYALTFGSAMVLGYGIEAKLFLKVIEACEEAESRKKINELSAKRRERLEDWYTNETKMMLKRIEEGA